MEISKTLRSRFKVVYFYSGLNGLFSQCIKRILIIFFLEMLVHVIYLVSIWSPFFGLEQKIGLRRMCCSLPYKLRESYLACLLLVGWFVVLLVGIASRQSYCFEALGVDDLAVGFA